MLTVTVQALPMGGPAVACHVFGVKPNTPGIDGFVRAARLLRDGPESADMRAATDAVGRAAQDIGLDRFKSFLQSSDDHLQARGGLITLARYLPDPSARLTNIPGLPVPTRLPWGPLIVGLAAQALPMMADLARRKDVSDTIKRFGLNPSKPADVTAAYAYLWAEDHGPWLFDTRQTGPEMLEMAGRVMRAARADPALFGRAVGGDDDAQREFSAAVAPPVPGSGIETRSDEERALVSQMMSAGRNGSDIQTALDSLRGAGKGPTAEDRRNTPCVAMISTPLPHIEGPWLAARNSDDGAPIPAQVAKKLVGQRFASFGDLRAAIWKEVAGTPELAREFSDRSLKLICDGNAPYPPNSEQVIIRSTGKLSQRPWELHHDPSIGRGGAVYDLSNIRVVTPRQHDQLESRGKPQ